MARIQYITQIDIDAGAVRLLPEECQRTGMRKPLVVTDAGVRAAGAASSATSQARIDSEVCRLALCGVSAGLSCGETRG